MTGSTRADGAVIVPDLPPVGAYSQAVVSSGPLLHIAGQVAVRADGTSVGAHDPATQAQQVAENLGAVLAAAGATFDNIIALRVYATTQAAAAAWGATRSEIFVEPMPASTLVYVSGLARPEWELEVDGVASLTVPPARSTDARS